MKSLQQEFNPSYRDNIREAARSALNSAGEKGKSAAEYLLTPGKTAAGAGSAAAAWEMLDGETNQLAHYLAEQASQNPEIVTDLSAEGAGQTVLGLLAAGAAGKYGLDRLRGSGQEYSDVSDERPSYQAEFNEDDWGSGEADDPEPWKGIDQV